MHKNTKFVAVPVLLIFYFCLLLLECVAGDTVCEADHVGFEAIAQLHSQIDDDQDGNLNRNESAEVVVRHFLCLPKHL